MAVSRMRSENMHYSLYYILQAIISLRSIVAWPLAISHAPGQTNSYITGCAVAPALC